MGTHVKVGNIRKTLETGNKDKCGKCSMWKNNQYEVKERRERNRNVRIISKRT